MPVPTEYQRATDDFYKLLMGARDSAGLMTTNQAYTMVQGVFQAFRRRVEIKEAIRFASVLPVGARALFVADWDVGEPMRPFEERAVITREVQELRRKHNFAPDTAIRDVCHRGKTQRRSRRIRASARYTLRRCTSFLAMMTGPQNPATKDVPTVITELAGLTLRYGDITTVWVSAAVSRAGDFVVLRDGSLQIEVHRLTSKGLSQR